MGNGIRFRDRSMVIKIKSVVITLQESFTEKCIVRYYVKYKKHWWSKWHYIMDERCGVPELFTVEQIFEPHFSKNIKARIK